MTEIIINGRFGSEDRAVVIWNDGSRREILAGAGEDTETFRERIRALAEAENARYVFFGGLPATAWREE
jgi:hypothetical protein